MIKVALVGLGKMGMGYDFENGVYKGTAKSHWGALSRIPGIEVVHLVDTYSTHNFVSEFSSLDVEVFCDFKSFCSRRRQYDLLILATPTETHLRVLQKILDKHHFKFIILEKPCGSNLQESQAIIDSLEKESINWQVNYFRSVLPNTLKATELVIKLAEKPISAEIYGYGQTLNIFSHFLHLLTTITQRDSLEIFDYNKTLGTPTITFNSGLKLRIKNLDGHRQEEPILTLMFPNYVLKFHENGQKIVFEKYPHGGVFQTLITPNFEDYQEFATKVYLEKFRTSAWDNRRRIEKVHEIVHKIDSLHV